MRHKPHREQRRAPMSDPPAASTEGGGRLRQEIELRAYYRYCERGCAPGFDREDWLAAEQEVLARQHGTAS